MQALRSAARRLWSASSEIEVMTVLSEILADGFSDHEMLGTFQRAAPGLWAFPLTLGDSRLQRRVQNLLADIAAGLTVNDIDQIMLHDVLTEPGQVGTSEVQENRFVREHIHVFCTLIRTHVRAIIFL